MLVWIKFNIMQNMTVINKLKTLQEIVEEKIWPVFAHSSIIVTFKYGYNSYFLPYYRKTLFSQAKLNIRLRIGMTE
jgi:hypothetical protein